MSEVPDKMRKEEAPHLTPNQGKNKTGLTHNQGKNKTGLTPIQDKNKTGLTPNQGKNKTGLTLNQGKNNTGLTPYQGKNRTCGMFLCYKCNKHWFSPNSWANCYQQCKGCGGKIYPYRQFRPEKGDGIRKNTPPHPQHLCQKCKQLRYFCGIHDVRREE